MDKMTGEKNSPEYPSISPSKDLPTVYINGRFITQPITGLQRYAHEITRRLLASSLNAESRRLNVKLFTPNVTWLGRGYKTFWEQAELLWRARKGILFSPCNAGPWFHPTHLLAVHDVRASNPAWNKSIPLLTRRYSSLSLSMLSRRAKRIVTVSKYSKQRIVEKYDICEDRVSVVYPGADHILDVAADFTIVARLGLEHAKYILAVNSLLPHKNMALLHSLDWNELGIKLCIVGSTPQVKSESLPRSGDQGIIYAGRVSDAQVRALYTRAFAYVFPSLYEGFGFPPLEAMYCGCPVIASNRTSIPEVCGEAAVYFDPLSATSLKDKITMLLDRPQLRMSMIGEGFKRALEFKWDTCASELETLLLKMYGEIVDRKRGRM